MPNCQKFKLAIFSIFNELLSTQNVNIARFARNVEWDILSDFYPMCLKQDLVYATLQKLSHLRVKWGIEHLHLNFHPQLTSLLWVSIFALLAFQFPDYFLSRFSTAIKFLTAISSATKPPCLKITEKVAFDIASEASYVFNLNGQKFIEMPKMFILATFWKPKTCCHTVLPDRLVG